MTIKQITRALDARMRIMARERDKLRDLESEVCEQCDRYEEAIDNLQACIDRLSEVV